jgi:hypothetical protein
MTQHNPPLDPLLEPLLERGRTIPPVPDVVRARSLARARAAVAAAVPHLPEPLPARWRRVLPLALAASVALAVGTAGAVVALRDRTPQAIVPAPPARPALAPRAQGIPVVPPTAEPAIAPQCDSTPKPPRRSASPPESYAAELELLQRAQTAYAGQDFSRALALVAEHGRRFPNGRLAEEREALRVRSLANSGRTHEAARALAAFSDHFPRSVLLPRLSRELR